MDKCKECYKLDGCMLTEKMRLMCEGPFKSHDAHIKSLKTCIISSKTVTVAKKAFDVRRRHVN